MRKEKPLYIILVLLFVTYVIVEYYSPKPLDWAITFAQDDKNPYGGYILYDRLDDFYTEKAVSFHTLSEAKDAEGHLLIVTTDFNPSGPDIDGLHDILAQGRTVMIAAQVFSQSFLDALRIDAKMQVLGSISADSITVSLEGGKIVTVPSSFVNTVFEIDSATVWQRHATSDGDVMISKDYSAAKLILTTMPLAFTNYALVHDDIYLFAENALNKIPEGIVLYNRYYHVGKQEPATPLRYVLSQAPLRWAVVLTIFVLLLYLIAGSRRLQRAIPVLAPLENTSLAFIKTIGALYHREGNHKNAALKLSGHFTHMLATRYYMHTFDERSYKVLSAKSGVALEDVVKTFDLMQVIKQSPKVSEELLKQLYGHITKFKIH